MAMLGWLTPAMAALYTRTADRKRMALAAGTGTERKLNILSPAPGQKCGAEDKLYN